MPTAVLDSSAVLAALFAEPGGQEVRAIMAAGIMASVNHAEVVTKLTERNWSTADIGAVLPSLEYEIAPFDEKLAIAAGFLRPSTRHLGLSIGDRACVALALRERLPIVTADRAWSELRVGVPIQVIR